MIFFSCPTRMARENQRSALDSPKSLGHAFKRLFSLLVCILSYMANLLGKSLQNNQYRVHAHIGNISGQSIPQRNNTIDPILSPKLYRSALVKGITSKLPSFSQGALESVVSTLVMYKWVWVVFFAFLFACLFLTIPYVNLLLKKLRFGTGGAVHVCNQLILYITMGFLMLSAILTPLLPYPSYIPPIVVLVTIFLASLFTCFYIIYVIYLFSLGVYEALSTNPSDDAQNKYTDSPDTQP